MLSSLKFLIVDDQSFTREIVSTVLKAAGAAKIDYASEGSGALERLRLSLPDIVITDWSMPIFDGLELTSMIRQPGANANPYVALIMLTGHSETKRVLESRDAGVTEFLAKPISAKALYQRILNVVVNPRPFVKTKTFFGPDRRRNHGTSYVGPERRKGEKAEMIKVQPLLDKTKTSM